MSWSGGKDSCLALYKALNQGIEIKFLLNFISRKYQRGCFHGISKDLITAQAKAIGIELVQFAVSDDMQTYEQEFKTAVNELKSKGAREMVFGDIYLLDHSNWVERVCRELDIIAREPLWDIPAEDLVNEFIDLGFKSIIVSVQAEKLGQEFIGRIIDKPLIKELKQRKVCPCGENGEFHSFVIDGPLFQQRIDIIDCDKLLREGFWQHWFLDIKNYRVVNKVN
jgi:uncharacterized protein (TIGR00290 family)